MTKQVQYMMSSHSTPAHHIIYRRILDDEGIAFDVWNSKTRSWTPSAKACDAFDGIDIFADPVSEGEVLKIIA